MSQGFASDLFHLEVTALYGVVEDLPSGSLVTHLTILRIPPPNQKRESDARYISRVLLLSSSVAIIGEKYIGAGFI